MIRRTLSEEPHPLEAVALAAFAGADCHDGTTLAAFLSGGTILSGRIGAPGMRAYRIVARDVLGYMEAQGKLCRDGDGWYRRKTP